LRKGRGLAMPEICRHLVRMDAQRKKPVLVVLSGAGISRESGLKTFRDSDGLWEGYNVMEVATPEAWAADPELVLEFYNKRRAQLDEVEPNAAHRALADLEDDFDVRIVTQNVDDLHERAGSTQVVHLHGQLRQVRAEDNPGVVESDILTVGGPEVPGPDIAMGDVDDRGVQLRPHVVWFGEAVPMMNKAAATVAQADAVLVVGTSMQVYPAAGLIDIAPSEVPVFMVNPDASAADGYRSRLDSFYALPASEGVPQWAAAIRLRLGH
jgi:NAD-dependent deacetylase